ncbi:MAG: prepilin-type N-terminal cleavage/methylation domain-containing protein [Armatimonadetes bacterium]|nr:prepilin-type N-terminal cleavage/methylation domain-containing protein [Armatimonadota bacterium]
MGRKVRQPAVGFTLIELMIVICILGILMLILFPNMVKAKYQGKLSTCIFNEKNVATALQVYSSQDEDQRYPSTLTELVTGRYINTLPKCPTTDTVYGYSAGTTPEAGFSVQCSGNHTALGIPSGYPQYFLDKGTVLR